MLDFIINFEMKLKTINIGILGMKIFVYFIVICHLFFHIFPIFLQNFSNTIDLTWQKWYKRESTIVDIERIAPIQQVSDIQYILKPKRTVNI